MSFLVLSLPRSRSAWLAHYLSYPLARPLQLVGHDILIECDSVDKFLDSYKNGMWGTCETNGAFLWRLVRQEMPECKVLLVRRPLIEAYQSFAATGFMPDLSEMAAIDAMLDAAAQDPKIVTVPYSTLSEPTVGKMLFEHLLELEFDFDWWARTVQLNITVDMEQWQNRVWDNKSLRKMLMEDVAKKSEGLKPCHLN